MHITCCCFVCVCNWVGEGWLEKVTFKQPYFSPAFVACHNESWGDKPGNYAMIRQFVLQKNR